MLCILVNCSFGVRTDVTGAGVEFVTVDDLGEAGFEIGIVTVGVTDFCADDFCATASLAVFPSFVGCTSGIVLIALAMFFDPSEGVLRVMGMFTIGLELVAGFCNSLFIALLIVDELVAELDASVTTGEVITTSSLLELAFLSAL